MKIMTILVASILALVAAFTYAAQAPEEPPLAVELNVHEAVVHLMLINRGDEPITVLSKVMNRDLDRNPRVAGEEWDGLLTLTLSLGTMEWRWNGHRMVGSKYAFMPTKLYPGEATVYDFTGPLGNPLRDLDADVTSVKVVYDMPAEYGERYGVWSGRAESPVYQVEEGRVQPLPQRHVSSTR